MSSAKLPGGCPGRRGAARIIPDGASLRRNLITGVTGFAGCYLARALLARGEASRGRRPGRLAGLAAPRRRRRTDRRRRRRRRRAGPTPCARVRPTHVYHLAGYAHAGRVVPASRRRPGHGNLTATRRLYEAVVRWGGKPRILFVGSGLVYGEPLDPRPCRSTRTRAAPRHALRRQQGGRRPGVLPVRLAAGLDIVRARPFNHIGPRQSAEFAVPNFARQLVAIERGEPPPVLETGDLSTRRDLTDVRDVVGAYLLLMERGRAGEAYNVGRGRSCSMQEVLDRLLALAGLRSRCGSGPTCCGRPSRRRCASTPASSAARPAGRRATRSTRRWRTPWTTGGGRDGRPDRRDETMKIAVIGTGYVGPGHRHLLRRERQRRGRRRQGRGKIARCSTAAASRSTSRACWSWSSATAARAG